MKKNAKLSGHKKMLESYREMKKASKSLGACRAWVLENNARIPKEKRLSPLQIKILEASKYVPPP